MTSGNLPSAPHGSRLPTLGPRGEGWVALQGVAIVAAAVAGLDGPAWSGPARIASSVAGLLGIVAGLALAGAAARTLGAALTPLPMPNAEARLVRTGAFRLVRHPIYGAVVIAAFGWGLLTASPAALLVALAILGFFDLKSRREEAWLVERFPEYPVYRAVTRRLLPWVY
jgi:protein-S-isoprenylcysteine O-methyltransferase Ste14